MARKTKEELNAIAVACGVPTLWSWSRYHCYKQDRWEYYLKYIQKLREDRRTSIYGVSGGAAHQILEDFYSGQIEYQDMLPRYEDALLLMNLDELKYNSQDADANRKTAHNYESCLRHFFQNHQPLPKPYLVEEFVLIRISETVVLHGYIDFMHIERREGQKHLTITDFKTSTAYKGKKIAEEAGQLLLYHEGMRQKTGLEAQRIHIQWNFLKYVNVECEQANGFSKTRQIPRHEIGTALASSARMWLKKSPAAYSGEQIDSFLSNMAANNTLCGLPPEVQSKFTISDCLVEIPVTGAAIQALKDDIAATVGEIIAKQAEHVTTGSEALFWQPVTDADSFRLANLSGYSRKLHKPYDEYLTEREMFQQQGGEEDDLAGLLEAI